MKKQKIVINLVAGPGCGKSLYSAYLFTLLKIHGINVEYVQEYAKDLVWRKKTELLRNQHIISYHQYRALKGASRYVDVVVTDGSLFHSYYYNRYSEINYSNVSLTEERIDKFISKFINITIFLKRNSKYSYETAGRYQSQNEAILIDSKIKDILDEKNVDYIEILADMDNVPKMLSYIQNKLKEFL